jgi:predicted AAA+ superfamily ATPase
LRKFWYVAPHQIIIPKENKKFIYSLIKKGARAKEFEIALQRLAEAGLIHTVSNITTPKLPLTAYAMIDFFKIYLVDVGLLCAMANVPAKTILYGNDLFQEFRGALTENYVTQELARNQYGLYYWTSENTAELDFVIQHDDQIYPVEIKSGHSGRKKSLHVYQEKYHPSLLIRVSPMNLKKDGQVLNIPLYFAQRIRAIIGLRARVICAKNRSTSGAPDSAHARL